MNNSKILIKATVLSKLKMLQFSFHYSDVYMYNYEMQY